VLALKVSGLKFIEILSILTVLSTSNMDTIGGKSMSGLDESDK